MKILDFLPAQAEALTKAMTEVPLSIRDNISSIVLEGSDFNDLNRQHFLWYGGDMVSIAYRGYRFIVSAVGDVIATLTRKSDNVEVCDIRDKGNTGQFGREIASYIKNDAELKQLMADDHPLYQLDLTDNNWWECFCYDPQGQFHDLMLALDSDGVIDAVVETAVAMDSIIEDLT